MNKIYTVNRKGFTLIELLVTVSIIAVLSGLLLGVINIQGLRQKARDSQRIADLKKIQVALEAYLADHRTYPVSSGSDWVNSTNDTLDAVLSPDYLSNFPNDPSTSPGTDGDPCANEASYRYNYISDGSRYILTAIMEVSSSNDDSPCNVISNWSYDPSGTAWGCAAGFATTNFCYGVQNP